MDQAYPLCEKAVGFAKNPNLYGFREWLPASTPALLRKMIDQIGAHEASIWMVDSEGGQLVTCYNTEELERIIVQPLSSGLVCKAYNEKHPVHHQGVHRYQDSSGKVDEQLAQKTQHQISVPFYLCGQLCGALSVVQLSSDFHSAPRAEVPWGFQEDAISVVAAAATVIAEGIEAKWKDVEGQ
ncbi:MAG: GAF domain-containing protein [Verrucomicrobiales bacterium]|nr:GAF domain-containing protein [Verrucomicrobiales bacterium]